MQSPCAVLHCYLCPVWLYRVFLHHLIKDTILEKKMLKIKYVFWFSLQRLSETFLDLRRNRKCTYIFTWSTHCSGHSLMKLEFIWQIFEKYLNIKFHENPSSDSRVPCGRTDRHDEANSFFFFLQFYIFWLNADKGQVAVFSIGGKKVLEVLHIFMWSVFRNACRRPVAFNIYFPQRTRKYKY